MQRSSDSIGALATALAKAQSEIANPEKSLTATIVSPFPREGSRTFRYAPLASGLDLVRKCLGQHEIATVQTTAMEKDSGLICLTTTLVHASGEWVSSDWPVCSVSETAAPHRLGAALTYARRYALFTLVGIAGEDDVDAPDLALPLPSGPPNGSPTHERGSTGPSSMAQAPSQPLQTMERRPRAERPKPANLSPQASEDLRRRLISELTQLSDPEALASWVQRSLPLKNQLSTADAELVEAAFAATLSQFGDATSALPADPRSASGHIDQPPSTGPGAEALVAIPKPVRERDRHHLKFVASQPCLVCGRIPSDAHHIKFAEPWAVGHKVSDKHAVPVCRLHHRELHRRGNERAWWQNRGIDPLPVAAALWKQTHVGEPIETEIANDANELTGMNGVHVTSGPLAAARDQNDETKPIVRPEVG
jgi:hypothetical protein